MPTSLLHSRDKKPIWLLTVFWSCNLKPSASTLFKLDRKSSHLSHKQTNWYNALTMHIVKFISKLTVNYDANIRIGTFVAFRFWSPNDVSGHKSRWLKSLVQYWFKEQCPPISICTWNLSFSTPSSFQSWRKKSSCDNLIFFLLWTWYFCLL